MSTNNNTSSSAPANGKRRQVLTTLAVVVAIAAAGWGAYEWLVASHYESTDNAYVAGNVICITLPAT